MKSQFARGLYHGIPVMLGYLSVSFGFGILAIQKNLSILAAIGISLSNLTSAGQVAGVGIIAAGGSMLEMILCQLVINIRYSLMSLTLSQRLDSSFTLTHRLIAAFGVTDEIFAIAASRPEPLTPKYMYGLMTLPIIGWTVGTAVGAAAGSAMPAPLTAALSLMLYGMFIAIIIPPAKKRPRVLFVVLLSAGLSILFRYLLPMVGEGFAVIICAVLSCVIAALLFPVDKVGEADG